MKQERVLAVVAGGVITTSGEKRAIGNALHVVGDLVWTDSGVVFGHERRHYDPPVVNDGRYRFADAIALKMYHVNKTFSKVMKTEDVKRPTEDTESSATLILHCYNNRHEYFVWMWYPDIGNARCLIQRDGKTLDDFISELPALPEYCDACIDNKGDLAWVAEATKYTDSAQTFTLCKYKNSDLVSSSEYTDVAARASTQETLHKMLVDAYNAATITIANPETTTTVIQVAVAPSAQFCTYLSACYDGKGTSTDVPTGAQYIANVVDLWGSDEYIRTFCSLYYGIGPHMAATLIDILTGSATDISYTPGALGLTGNLHRYNKASNSNVVAEWLDVIGVVETTVRSEYSLYRTIEKTGEGSIPGVVAAVNATDKFNVSIDYPLISPTQTGGMGVTGCVLTFTSGANKGASRSISSTTPASGNYTLTFDAPWGFTPAVGDAFTVAVAFADHTDEYTECDYMYSAASFVPTVRNEDIAITTDLGNDYNLISKLAPIESETSPKIQWQVDNGDEKIYGGEPAYVCLVCAWLTSSQALAGLLPGGTKSVKARNKTTVTTSDVSMLSSNIVTKRFVRS